MLLKHNLSLFGSIINWPFSYRFCQRTISTFLQNVFLMQFPTSPSSSSSSAAASSLYKLLMFLRILLHMTNESLFQKMHNEILFAGAAAVASLEIPFRKVSCKADSGKVLRNWNWNEFKKVSFSCSSLAFSLGNRIRNSIEIATQNGKMKIKIKILILNLIAGPQGVFTISLSLSRSLSACCVSQVSKVPKSRREEALLHLQRFMPGTPHWLAATLIWLLA